MWQRIALCALAPIILAWQHPQCHQVHCRRGGPSRATEAATPPPPDTNDAVSVILLAGGVGSRMQADRPKQFLNLRGKPVLMHSLDLFLSLTGIAQYVTFSFVSALAESFRPLNRAGSCLCSTLPTATNSPRTTMPAFPSLILALSARTRYGTVSRPATNHRRSFVFTTPPDRS